MSTRAAGIFLVLAAVLFWLAWSLMPGVGITDAQLILTIVARHRSQVALSVVLQLLSSACYAAALVGLVAKPALGADRSVQRGAIALLIGAMGSAADAVFHLLAYVMTAPGMDPTSLVPVMQVMQGPGLRFILPLILAFFVGSVWLSIALGRQQLVSRWNPWLYAFAVGVGLVGGLLGSRVAIPPRIVGLTVLALFAGAQVWLGVALLRSARCTP